MNTSKSSFQNHFHQQIPFLPNVEEQVPQERLPFSPAPSLPKQEPKNSFKWTYQEHAKYIYFLQLNKLKIKSKLIRKSNAFFKEMEKFLSTKTALQCRSHHQKFEERYKFPHRIITGQKKYIPLQIYKGVVQRNNFTDFIGSNENGSKGPSSLTLSLPNAYPAKEYATISCQTDICDLNKPIYTDHPPVQAPPQPATLNFTYPFAQSFMYYPPYQYLY